MPSTHKGVAINDKKWREMQARVATMNQHVIKVGVIGAEAEAEVEGGITMGRLAGVHEYGAAIRIGNTIIVIPERSFIRATIAAGEAKYSPLMARLTDRVLQGKLTEQQALGQLGLRVVGDIQKRMAQGIDPANAASTIARKGSDKPLIDTGRLRQSVTFAVVDENTAE